MNASRSCRPLLFTALGALALAACSDPVASTDAGMDSGRMRDAPPFDAWFPPVPTATIAAGNAVAPGDPLFEGQQRFLYDAFGTEVLGDWPPADFMLALMTDEPAVFGNQYESFGFVPNPDDDFPWGFTRGLEDPTFVHETCALCHVGRLPDGTLWLGLPNGDLDFARFRLEVSTRWEAAGNPPLLDALDASKALAYGPGRTAAESDDYPVAVPADFPPYLLLGARTATNHLGTGGNLRTEVFLGVFTFGAGDPDTAVPFPLADRLDPMIATMGAFAPPAAPAGDPTTIAAGRSVFERERCGECHHVDDVALDGVVTYDREPGGRERFPGDDPMFSRGSIRTDYLHRILIDGEPPVDAGGADGGAAIDAGTGGPDPGFADILAFISRNRLAVRASDGYRVPLTHALWATAPYLHNGSVPTLDDLLRPAAARPATFMRGDFLVDTALPGNSNAGHEFGTAISDADRAALVAYLLSL